MHRSVLQNGVYGKYAAQNTVEVITMEEMDQALREESRHVRTYKDKDEYGEPTEYLAEFPGLTIEELELLSNSPAVNYMQGNRIPYTAIVDPHDLKELEGLRGMRTPKELIAVISKHRKTLTARYGKGVDRKLWDSVTESLVQIDIQLAASDLDQALAVHRLLARQTLREPEVLQRRVRNAFEVILDDAALRLDKLEAKIAKGEAKAVANELRKLARSLAGSRLAERIAGLLEKTNP